MNRVEAEKWIVELNNAVQNGHLTQYKADDEVFAEMETGDHDQETEKFFDTVLRSNVGEF